MLPYASFAAALADEPREGVEGYVVHFLGSDRRVKIKGSWYLNLHRAITGLHARVVWEHLRDGHPLDELLGPLPDEFHPWVRQVADHLQQQVTDAAQVVQDEHERITHALGPGHTRKDYALMARGHRQSACLFLRLDGRDFTPALWRQFDPGTDWRPTRWPSDSREAA